MVTNEDTLETKSGSISLYFSSGATLDDSHLSSVSEAGFESLQGGELKGVPVSVSLELSRWLLSREIRFELPPLELRFKSAMLCSKKNKGGGISAGTLPGTRAEAKGSPSSSSARARGEGTD